MHADGVIHGLPTPDGQPIRGPHNFRPFYQAFRSAFPGIAIEVQQVVSQGGKAVAYCRVTGTHRGAGLDIPARARRSSSSASRCARWRTIRSSKAGTASTSSDMYRQLGAEISMPPTTRGAGA